MTTNTLIETLVNLEVWRLLGILGLICWIMILVARYMFSEDKNTL